MRNDHLDLSDVDQMESEPRLTLLEAEPATVSQAEDDQEDEEDSAGCEYS